MNKSECIEVIARAIIVHQNKILLCQVRGESYFFLPGGHVEFGESGEETLRREAKEEFGGSLQSAKFLGIVEHQYGKKNKKRHEVNLVYRAKLRGASVKSIEDHIVFAWKDIKELNRAKVLPEELKIKLSVWLKK